MPANQVLINLFGGMSLLLYGMHIAGNGMESAAGGRLRVLLGKLTDQRLMGLGVGAVVTAVLQSSSATTVMLVGLVSAGFMGLEQTIGVILGADIGTTLTVQLIAFNILQYSVLLIGVGATMMLATDRRQYNYVGQAILGFGFIFLALRLVGDAMVPLQDSSLFQDLLLALTETPLLSLILSGLFTVLIQSSAGTISLALAFSTRGLVPLNLAIPIILGANVGTSATALISSLGGSIEAKRVAIAHTLFKLLGVVLFYPLMGPFAQLVAWTSNDVARQIANAHSIFNIAIALLVLPLAGLFANLIRRMIPEISPEEDEQRPRYLDRHMLDSPALAIGQATRETLHLADVVQSMLRDTNRVFEENDERLMEDVIRRDDRADHLEEEIKRFLAGLSEQSLTEELSRQEVGLLYVTNDLEHIGDIISKSTMSLARKKIEGRRFFSNEGREEIRDMHAKVSENVELAVAAFASQNKGLAEKVVRHKAKINEIERGLRQTHIDRLHQGLTETLETSEIHLDLLNDLKRINSHATDIAYVVLGEL